MGTRNLTMVQYKGEIRVAQYGQWDGYPNGQGETASEFIRKKMDLKKFRAAVEKCKQVDPDKLKKLWREAGAGPDGLIEYSKAEKFGKEYPEFSRNTGAEILELIQGGLREIDIETDFAADSLFCEWAYVVNLDDQTLEVYKGFNTKKLTKKDRFHYLQAKSKPLKTDPKITYYPVKLLASYKFSELTESTMSDLEKSLKDEE
jgi:hypothetical protein